MNKNNKKNIRLFLFILFLLGVYIINIEDKSVNEDLTINKLKDVTPKEEYKELDLELVEVTQLMTEEQPHKSKYADKKTEYYSYISDFRRYTDTNNRIGYKHTTYNEPVNKVVGLTIDEVYSEYVLPRDITPTIFEKATGIKYNDTVHMDLTKSTIVFGDVEIIIEAYPIYEEYIIDIYDDDIFFDDYLGFAIYRNPIGVEFHLYR